MKTLSVAGEKHNTKKTSSYFEAAVQALTSAVLESLPEKAGFGEFEKLLLEVSNEVERQILSRRLESIASLYDADFILVDGLRYKRHELGEVEYHSLCGSMRVPRYTYRQVGIHNGPTVVPMDLAAELMEKATPALAFRAALGDAQCPSRQWEAQLHASCRRPPSRSTLARIAKKVGDTVRETAPEILPEVRKQEAIHKDAVALSIGLDRTTIPMEEPLRNGDLRDPSLRRRKKPYVRKPPKPVEVNYRMGYVGTVSAIGEDGDSLQTYKYGCSADVDPAEVLKMMTDDLLHIQRKRKACRLPELPMGIIQDGAPEMWNLVESSVSKAMPESRFEKGIDRFHLTERLAESLKALRDPFGVYREVTLDAWRIKLENRDDAIDEIEKLLKKEVARDKKNKQINKANAEILRSHLTYIENNKRYMRYATLRKKGIPTGSGATEGACKSLIMIRTKGCGQRWHSRGVNSVLALRSLYLSDRLHQFWTTMCKQREVCIQEAA
jgi:hypothetical protein